MKSYILKWSCVAAIFLAGLSLGGISMAATLIFLFEEEVSLDVLRQRLVSDERIRNVDEVFVQADEQVPYGVVAQVLALVRQAGIGKMGLVTDPVTRKPR